MLRSQGFSADEVGEESLDLGPFTVGALPVRHEPILAAEIPTVLAFLVNDRFLNPGDSFDERLHQFSELRRWRCHDGAVPHRDRRLRVRQGDASTKSSLFTTATPATGS
jgi:hypothetical protein